MGRFSSCALVLALVASGCEPPPPPALPPPFLPAPPPPVCPSAAPSALTVTTPPDAGTDSTTTKEPPHETFALVSKGLGESRRINLYTPPGYADSTARFPVLYLLDGGDDEDFPHPHIMTTVDEAIRSGEMRPIVVVGIENTERRRDMTDPTQVDSDRKIAAHVGGSAAFRAFIRDELMPEIGKRVRTSGKAAIAGESLAGLFVVETFFVEPALFDTYIAISPSLWWNGQALARGADAWMKAHAKLEKTLYLTGAGDDIGEPIAMLGAALRAHAPRGLVWSYEPRSDLRHATIYEAVAPAVLRKTLAP